MEVSLKYRPKSPIIIDGFPGFGMVGTIATEFLIEHLKTESIGKIIFEDMPALVAIHEGRVVEPFGIFYNKKYNIVIVHAIGGQSGTEWKIADIILKIAYDLKAKEIISLEGIGTQNEIQESRTFYFSRDAEKVTKFKNINMQPLNEGIIMGVTSALLLKTEGIPVSCVFAETHSNMPDSKAAAKIIQALDGYLHLNIDPKPLMEMAVKFEDKLKSIVQQSKIAELQRDKKEMSYLG